MPDRTDNIYIFNLFFVAMSMKAYFLFLKGKPGFWDNLETSGAGTRGPGLLADAEICSAWVWVSDHPQDSVYKPNM